MGASSASSTDPWLSNQKITSAEGRLALSASWAKQVGSNILTEGGVVEGAGPTASVSGNSINVTAHQNIVEAAGGTYVCSTTGTLNVPIDTPLPSSGQSRFDIIYAEVIEGSDSATWRLNTVKGTASASPSIPSAPSNTTPLFRVPVTNAAPQTPVPIFGWARAPGAPRLVETGDTRAGAYIGDRRKFRDGREDVWSGSQWITTVAPAAWSQFTPALSFAGAGGGPPGTVNLGSGGQAIGKYVQAGKLLHIAYTFYFGTAGLDGGSGDISTTLPPGLTSRSGLETHIFCYLFSGTEIPLSWAGSCYVPVSSTLLFPRFPAQAADCRLSAFRIASAVGAAGTGVPLLVGEYSVAPGGILSITGTIEIA